MTEFQISHTEMRCFVASAVNFNFNFSYDKKQELNI